ncbi:MAG TPA: response regulator transcription factor [Actinophytocola sp.]|uniref:response regulator transcription factor n=1 Tax=Actinophytocola sp. TaxID=1872138 RepID=UPI002F91FDCA
MTAQPRGPVAVEGGRRNALRVLLVEDDDNFAESVAKVLARLGHEPTRVSHGGDAAVRHRDADVVLLDLMLPDGNGLDVLRGLRKVTDVPVLVLTAVGDTRTLVRALHLGADDYLVKPFRADELLARIDAVMRRSKLSDQPPPQVVTVRDVEIDLGARRVVAGGAEVSLTGTEFDVLATLARRRGTAVERERLMDEVYGDASRARSQSLGVHLTSLRRKLDRPGLIATLHGFGYRLEG